MWGMGTSPSVPPGALSTGSFSPGVQIGTGPYLFIDPDNVPVGTYLLNYKVATGACADVAKVTLTVRAGVDAGVALSGITYCADDSNPKNAFSSWLSGSPTPGGTWTGSGAVPPAWNAGAGTFTPSLAGVVAGTTNFIFQYNVATPTGGGPANDPQCTTGYCTDSTTITISVTAAGYAGGNAEVTVCNAP